MLLCNIPLACILRHLMERRDGQRTDPGSYPKASRIVRMVHMPARSTRLKYMQRITFFLRRNYKGFLRDSLSASTRLHAGWALLLLLSTSLLLSVSHSLIQLFLYPWTSRHRIHIKGTYHRTTTWKNRDRYTKNEERKQRTCLLWDLNLLQMIAMLLGYGRFMALQWKGAGGERGAGSRGAGKDIEGRKRGAMLIGIYNSHKQSEGRSSIPRK
jgi:hypothetical protein